MAIQAARALPQRPFPHEPTDAPALFSNMSANDQNKYRAKVKEDSNAREERARPAYRLPRRNR